jgi:diaminohydroxyphosphoribosylaminopyrimidine deaminase / 5-amino-6-(5-phosphoribosylamino)uracil reductase
MFSDIDRRYMSRALELAQRGLYTTTPNPRVGCVLVRDGEIVGEGWHEQAGGAHAEVRALQAAKERAQGATAYVTLEPCSHHGRTAPCTQALIAAHVTRVVAAMQDPNPLVAGGGLDALRAVGITAECGLMESESRALNPGFFSRMTRERPWVRMKIAASLDGKTALLNGRSQWITGAEARLDGHRWRARACAILTGIGTVKDDDPQLNVREIETPRQPMRVVVDSRCETPLSARVLGTGTLIAAAIEIEARGSALRSTGAEIVVLPDTSGKVDLHALMRELGKRGMNEVHVEAGYKLNGSLLAAGLVDELLIYLAPRVVGDAARGMFNLPALDDLAHARELELCEVIQVGRDLRVIAKIGSD